MIHHGSPKLPDCPWWFVPGVSNPGLEAVKALLQVVFPHPMLDVHKRVLLGLHILLHRTSFSKEALYKTGYTFRESFMVEKFCGGRIMCHPWTHQLDIFRTPQMDWLKKTFIIVERTKSIQPLQKETNVFLFTYNILILSCNMELYESLNCDLI